MKKVMGLLFFVGLLSGCDSDSAPSPRLWIQVPEIPVAVTANYSLSDINIDIYSSKDNYVNEVNPVYEGKLNSEGTIELNEGIESGVLYYVDIYTDDNVISNWSPSSGAFSSDPLESVSYESNEFSGIPITVFLVTNTKAFLGEWSFVGYNEQLNSYGPHDRTERTKLVIRKDFSAESFETFNGVSYSINYMITGVSGDASISDGAQCSLKYVETLPSENGYPYIQLAESTIALNIEPRMVIRPETNGRLLDFNDYPDENVFYGK